MAISVLPEHSYAEFVEDRFDEARDNNARVVFTNRGRHDALIVLKAFFQNATKSLEMYTGCLTNEVYDPQTLIACAKRLPKEAIRILVADRPVAESSALFDLKAEAATGSILVRQFREAADDVAQRYQYFVICDGKHFRIERDHSEKIAVVILNGSGEDVAKEYAELFEQLWHRSEPFDWTRVRSVVAAVA